MDLLGGYKSDGDSSSASSSYSQPQNQNHPQSSPAALAERQLPIQAAVAAASKQKQQQQQQQQNKGKRLLKLNAVLPPDILERLTRSTVNRKGSNPAATNDGDEWSESDSSESEDEILRGHKGYGHQGGSSSSKSSSSSRRINTTSRPAATTTTTTNNNTFHQREDSKKDTVSDMMDSDLCSLLDDLKSHVPSTGPSKVATGGKEEKVGMAFMKVVSSSVVRRKRTEPLPAVDIHERSGSWQSKLPDDATMDNKVPEPKPQEPMEESDHEKVMAIEQPSVPSHRRAFVGIKRARNAAPSVSTSTFSNPSNTEVDDEVTQQPTQAVVSSHDAQQRRQQQQQQEYEENGEFIPSLSSSSKKRSKRELEKALRAGDFDALQDCTHKIEAPNQIPHNASSLVLEGGGGGGSGGSSSFGSSGLERYVPSEGTTVKQTGLSAKMRGKHQIHSLVVSASKYEADQRRMAVMGMGGQQGKSKRADAKKKYGW
jgi:hypothetical protein